MRNFDITYIQRSMKIIISKRVVRNGIVRENHVGQCNNYLPDVSAISVRAATAFAT